MSVSFSIDGSPKKSKSIGGGAQYHKPKPPPVFRKLAKTASCADVAPEILEGIRKCAYRHGCPAALYWFIDSENVYIMPTSHPMNAIWESSFNHAKVGEYGFVRPEGQKMIRPDVGWIRHDLISHVLENCPS